MGLLAFHRISGLTETDLFMPNSTDIRSQSCFGSACEDWSCLPEEAFHWDVAVRYLRMIIKRQELCDLQGNFTGQ